MRDAHGCWTLPGTHWRRLIPAPQAKTGPAVWWVFVVGAFLVSGCERQTGPKVCLVRGQVFLDGAPLASATVGFSPVDASVGLPATGCTDATGAFLLTTVQGGRRNGGAVPGDYVVTIDKVIVEETAAGTNRSPSRDGDPGLPPPPSFRSLIPADYGKRQFSGLRVTVNSGVNEGPAFRFDLRSDFRGQR